NFCDVNYVNEDNGIAFQENFVNSYKEGAQYAQYSIDPCSSSGTYAQILQNGAHSESVPSSVESPSASGNVMSLHEDSVDSHHSQVQEANDTLEPIALDLQQVSIIHHNIPSLGTYPIILDRNSLAALISGSRDGSFTLDVSNLPRTLLSSQNISQRAVVMPEQAQFLTSDASIPNLSQNILSPMLSQKDLTSMISSPSTSTTSVSSGVGTHFLLITSICLHKSMRLKCLNPLQMPV
ncbi:PR domain zinc finger protein 10, partial [Caerostris extrusa]